MQIVRSALHVQSEHNVLKDLWFIQVCEKTGCRLHTLLQEMHHLRLVPNQVVKLELIY